MITFDKRAAHAARIAGTAHPRFILNSVRIQHDAARYNVEASDGKMLVRLSGDSLADEFPEVPGFDAKANGATVACVSARDFADAIKGMPKHPKGGHGVLHQVAATLTETALTLCGTDLQRASVVPIRTMQGSLPDFDQIIPKGGEIAARFAVDAGALRELLAAVSGFAGPESDAVVFEVRKADRPIVVRAKHEDREAVGVLMPLLMDEPIPEASGTAR